jgi:hypothetical protein
MYLTTHLLQITREEIVDILDDCVALAFRGCPHDSWQINDGEIRDIWSHNLDLDVLVMAKRGVATQLPREGFDMRGDVRLLVNYDDIVTVARSQLGRPIRTLGHGQLGGAASDEPRTTRKGDPRDRFEHR